MKKSDIAASVWNSLYERARAFHQLKPWTWMTDRDLFAVEDPQSGETCYCCIMGELGEVFGLAVYLGAEGLESYKIIQSEFVDVYDLEMVNLQRCLLVSFENRNDLDKQDLQMIRKLGLSFRGRNVWPQFRSMRPGYLPWYLTDEEARLLATVLERTIQVVQRLKENPRILVPPKKGLVLVQTYKNGTWNGEWRQPDVLDKQEISPPAVDDVRLQRMKKNLKKGEHVWELGSFLAPTPVKEGSDRPFFPRAMVIMDHTSGLALHTYLTHPREYMSEFQNSFLTYVEEQQIAPHQLLVSTYEDYTMLQPIAKRLNIRLNVVEALECVDDFREHLYETLM